MPVSTDTAEIDHLGRGEASHFAMQSLKKIVENSNYCCVSCLLADLIAADWVDISKNASDFDEMETWINDMCNKSFYRVQDFVNAINDMADKEKLH